MDLGIWGRCVHIFHFYGVLTFSFDFQPFICIPAFSCCVTQYINIYVCYNFTKDCISHQYNKPLWPHSLFASVYSLTKNSYLDPFSLCLLHKIKLSVLYIKPLWITLF
jgi:hypothetical protein